MPVKVPMPALSPTIKSGKLAKWCKKEGEMVESGQVLAEIETDKATMEFEVVDVGKLAKILVKEGTENLEVNCPIALILEEGETEEESLNLHQMIALAQVILKLVLQIWQKKIKLIQ